jgi:hypothetical protein
MHMLRTHLADQYHECVPLGWNPVPVAGVFSPGYSTEFRQTVEWLPAFWLGKIQMGELTHADGRVAYQVLEALVRKGLLEKHVAQGSFRYNLTLRGLPYYFDRNQYGNNPDHLPYLCYSTIVPVDVTWSQSLRVERIWDEFPRMQVFRAAFTWRVGPDAEWANDAILRSHSVILTPTQSPALAKLVNWGGDWEIEHIYTFTPMLPKLADASVWPSLQIRDRRRFGR